MGTSATGRLKIAGAFAHANKRALTLSPHVKGHVSLVEMPAPILIMTVAAPVEADAELGRRGDLGRYVAESLDACVEARLVQVTVVAVTLEARVTVTDLLGRVIAVAVVENDLADFLVGELEACSYLPRWGQRGVDAALDRQLWADNCDSRDSEGGAREGDIHDDAPLAIRKFGDGFEG